MDRHTYLKTFLFILAGVLLLAFIVYFSRLHKEPGISAVPTPPPKIKAPPSPAKEAKTVLSSTLAGRWYPSDADTLSKQVAALFQKTDVNSSENVVALILPHAGYQYSGRVAAMGLQSLGKKYKRIVVIGPSHYTFMEDVLSVPQATHYQTPVGEVPLDVELINKLLTYPMFQNIPQVNQLEHSTQIQVPLLQYAQKDFKLVPIVAGNCAPETVSRVAAILKSLIDGDTLVIASSDFVHYGPNYNFVPFKDNVPERIKNLDMGAYEYIAKLDAAGFQKYISDTGATICGNVPIAILLSMLDKTVETKLIKYTTSGELTGDYSNSVSYFAIAFYGIWNSGPEIAPTAVPELTEAEKKQLLILARKSIVYFLEKRDAPELSDLNITISDTLKKPRAAFVTLKKFVKTVLPGPRNDTELRGCIGDIMPRQPLYKSVIYNAINAAVNDRRFYPVSKNELGDIEIEISVLTVPKPISSPKEIRIGADGVILSKNGRSAVFLPQVAPEQGWDVDETLTHLAVKAGLSGNDWKEGAHFETFQAVVFGENQ
jgi:AmmeMemoRadiSam system protein B/AmmeMemoRadiSam system protein A